MSKQSERREVWRKMVRDQQSSGKTVRAFCRDHQISEHSFYQWRHRLRSYPEEPVRFALVETTLAAAAGQSSQRQLELIVCGGARLLVPAEAAVLRLVLGVLREHGQTAQ